MNLQNTFQKFSQRQSGQNPWTALRAEGFRSFQAKGLPTKLDEEWKYTSLKSLPEEALVPAEFQPKLSDAELKEKLEAFLKPDFLHLVMVDGVLNEKLSSFKDLKSLKIVPLDQVESTSVLPALDKARSRIGELRTDAMEALNSAFAEKGFVIEIPAQTSLGKTIQILHFSEAEGASYPKILIQVGEGSVLSLVETFVSQSQKSLTDSVTEVILEPSAKLEYVRVQTEGFQKTHVGCSRFFLKENSTLESLSYATGGLLFRHNLDVYCIGENAFAQVNGLTLGVQNQHFDNHTKIDHVVGHCNTNQTYKSVLDDESRAVFNGQVFIRKNSQKANSEQLNNNLLLSSKAEADTKPQLDIYADDVKATHGGTVGQLNPEELFYFLSRGIPKSKALEMLSLGFVNDLIDRVSSENIRVWLSGLLQQAYHKMKGS